MFPATRPILDFGLDPKPFYAILMAVQSHYRKKISLSPPTLLSYLTVYLTLPTTQT